MIRNIQALSARIHDVVVVGGGIYGACVAWEAASRGLSVALLERGDFSSATTANSYKIAHGGIRYLQHGDIARVRASSRERSALLRIAPHLVRPVPILIPTYGRGMKGKAVLRVGFAAYDALTWDRNRGIRDSAGRVPAAKSLSRSRVLEIFPDLPTEGLTGGMVFHDGQMYSPPRIVLSFLRSAVSLGGAVANYMEVVGFLREEGRVVGVQARDLLAGADVTVRGKMVVNAAGPWAARLLSKGLGVDLGSRAPSFSRDVGLVVRRQLRPDMGLAAQTSTRDADAVLDRGGRHLFLLPWREHTLVGVWHGEYSGSPEDVQVSSSELDLFVDDANRAYPGLRLRKEEIGLVVTGLILFGDDQKDSEGHSFGRRSLIIDHRVENGLEGLLSVVGVRATVARGVAERTVDRISRDLPDRVRPSRTEHTPIWGGDFESLDGVVQQIQETMPALSRPVVRALACNHGSRFGDVLAHTTFHPRLGTPVPGSQTLRAEVVHAVREEMAQTLEDVVLRRTDLGTAGYPGQAALRDCAEVMASESGWSEERARREVETCVVPIAGDAPCDT